MHKVRVIVTCECKVIRDGIALIFNSTNNLEVVGRAGADMLEEAFKLQPDLLVFELCSTSEGEYEALRKLKEMCGWTKIIIYSSKPLQKQIIRSYLRICDGYIQGPILPGFMLKAMELACCSGYFFFLGSSKDIKPEIKEEAQHVLAEDFSSRN